MFCKRLNGKCQIKHAILPVAFLLLFISWVPLVTAGVGKDTVYPIYDIVVYGDFQVRSLLRLLPSVWDIVSFWSIPQIFLVG